MASKPRLFSYFMEKSIRSLTENSSREEINGNTVALCQSFLTRGLYAWLLHAGIGEWLNQLLALLFKI